MRNKALLFIVGLVSIVLIVVTTLVPLIDPTLQTLVLMLGIVLNVIIIILFVFVREKTGVEAKATPTVVTDAKTRYKFEVYKDKIGEFRFRLVAPNGECVASGEGYTSKAGCLDGIENIKENALHARIEDTTKED